jgi:hypothetical protein
MIPSAPVGLPESSELTGVSSGIAERAEALDGAKGACAAEASDPLTRIAEEIAEGRVSRDQAVERIIAETLDSEIVRAAPSEVRAEIKEMLDALVATDPHLQSLVRNLGSTPPSEDL